LNILGPDIIKHNTVEYELGNSIYEYLESLNRMCNIMDKIFYFIGGLDSEPTILPRRKKE